MVERKVGRERGTAYRSNFRQLSVHVRDTKVALQPTLYAEHVLCLVSDEFLAGLHGGSLVLAPLLGRRASEGPLAPRRWTWPSGTTQHRASPGGG